MWLSERSTVLVDFWTRHRFWLIGAGMKSYHHLPLLDNELPAMGLIPGPGRSVFTVMDDVSCFKFRVDSKFIRAGQPKQIWAVSSWYWWWQWWWRWRWRWMALDGTGPMRHLGNSWIDEMLCRVLSGCVSFAPWPKKNQFGLIQLGKFTIWQSEFCSPQTCGFFPESGLSLLGLGCTSRLWWSGVCRAFFVRFQ